MQPMPDEIRYDVRLDAGQPLELPQDAARIVGPGHWVVTIRPADRAAPGRDHSAFLNSYGPEDEGLYDDYSSG